MVGSTDRPAISNQQAKRFKALDSIVFGAFLKLFSCVTLFAAVFFWANILGVFGDDVAVLHAENHYQAYILVGAAILTPAVTVGLWLGMRWGIVLGSVLCSGLLTLHFFFRPIDFSFYSFASLLSVFLVFYGVGLSVRRFFQQKQNDF